MKLATKRLQYQCKSTLVLKNREGHLRAKDVVMLQLQCT